MIEEAKRKLNDWERKKKIKDWKERKIKHWEWKKMKWSRKNKWNDWGKEINKMRWIREKIGN